MTTNKREDLKNKVAAKAAAGAAAGAGAPANRQAAPVHGIKSLMATDAVKNRFDEVLKARAPQFMASIINLVNGSPELQKADGMTVIQSAMVAAALDLPVDKNLGYMWIIARWDKNANGFTASPQLGYKGYIQLALRTGQYRGINVIDVYEGELVSFNRLTEKVELDFDAKLSDAVIGYAAHFELLNGFKKTVYWTKEQVEKHKTRFSKTDKLWSTDWDAMARKTVLKAMLSRWGILSIDMQKAFSEDREEVGEGADLPITPPTGAPMEYDPDAYIHPDVANVNTETGEISENEGEPKDES